MRKIILYLSLLFVTLGSAQTRNHMKEVWPDGTPIDTWFNNTEKVDVNALGKSYVITDYGVQNDSNIVQTKAIQHVIDLAAEKGGGVIIVPNGTFLSGSLFFKQ